jgi:hypothetical protein
VRAARREQLAAERARAEAEAEAAATAEAAAAAETAAAEAREGFPELARERGELAERLEEAERRSEALRNELRSSDERGGAHQLALEAAQRRVAKEAERADAATAVAARRAGEAHEARQEAERLRVALGRASTRASAGSPAEPLGFAGSLGAFAFARADGGRPGDEAAAADAAAVRARRSAVAASEAAAAAKRASSGGRGSGADGAYASSFERTSRASSSPRRPGVSSRVSPRVARFRVRFRVRFRNLSAARRRRGGGLGAAPPAWPLGRPLLGRLLGRGVRGWRERRSRDRSRESFARAEVVASRDDFSFPDRDGSLPSPPRRDRPSRPRAFSASRSALDAEMENATALLDALREGRAAASLDGSDVSPSSRSRSGSPVATRRHRRDSQSLYTSGDEGSFRSYQYQYE